MKPVFALRIAPVAEIKVDQAGYPASGAKAAFVVANAAGGEFTVRRAQGGAIAYKGSLSPAVEDPDSGDRVQTAPSPGSDLRGRRRRDSCHRTGC